MLGINARIAIYKNIVKNACFHFHVLNAHDSSIDRGVPVEPLDVSFSPLIPNRRVNEINAAGAGQVNYARLPPRISSRSANGRPLAMGIRRRVCARRTRPRRTCSSSPPPPSLHSNNAGSISCLLVIARDVNTVSHVYISVCVSCAVLESWLI